MKEINAVTQIPYTFIHNSDNACVTISVNTTPSEQIKIYLELVKRHLRKVI